MKIQKTRNKTNPIKILIETIGTIQNKPGVYAPFIAFALLEFIALILIYLAPRMPFLPVLGPPIRAFWGEKFLHYPANFLLIPKLASMSRTTLAVLAGSLLSGIAVAKIYGRPVKIAFKKYLTLFLIVFLIAVMFYGAFTIVNKLLIKYFMSGHKKLLFLGPGLWMGTGLYLLNFFIALLLQSVFAYAIPGVIHRDENLFKALIKSLVFFRKNIAITLILVGLPMLIYIPIIILNANTVFLISRFIPESVLYVSILSLIFSSLIIDPLITVSTALLYIRKNE